MCKNRLSCTFGCPRAGFPPPSHATTLLPTTSMMGVFFTQSMAQWGFTSLASTSYPTPGALTKTEFLNMFSCNPPLTPCFLDFHWCRVIQRLRNNREATFGHHSRELKQAWFLAIEKKNSRENNPKLKGQNVRNFQYPVLIRWSRQPNLVPFYL